MATWRTDAVWLDQPGENRDITRSDHADDVRATIILTAPAGSEAAVVTVDGNYFESPTFKTTASVDAVVATQDFGSPARAGELADHQAGGG
jgi:hypothetical protein